MTKKQLQMNEIRITKVYPRYIWKWNIKEDCCLICQLEFNTSCNKCSHPINCVPVTGECGHTFHLHCLEEWTEKNENCPICRKLFVIFKVYKHK